MMVIVNGITQSQSYHLHISPICRLCAELDNNLIISHGVSGISSPECGVCGKILNANGQLLGSIEMIDRLKSLLKSKNRERKIDDILI